MIEAGKVEVLGEEIPVILRGFTFEAEFAGVQASADSRAELEERLKKIVRESRVEASIAVVVWHREEWARATLRRKHASRRGAFMFHVGASSETIENPTIIGRGEEISDEEIADLNRLRLAARDAERAYNKRKHEIEGRGRTREGWSVSAAKLIEDEAAGAANKTS